MVSLMCLGSPSLALSSCGDIVALTQPDLDKSLFWLNRSKLVVYLCDDGLHIRDYEEEAPWLNRNGEKHRDDGATNGLANSSA